MNSNKTIRGHSKKIKIKKSSERIIVCWLDLLKKFIDLMTSKFCQPDLEKLDITAKLEKIKLEYILELAKFRINKFILG